jgi:hypothetical protein|tara:strand:+ start:113 stop:580 length:468 start_codon:yes stop_codon:yes gene_type:complete
MKEEQITQIVLKQSKLGRPVSKPDPEIVEKVLEHVALGGTLRAFCRQKGMPSYRTLYRWLDKDQEFLSRFTYVSRFLGARAIAEEALALVDTPPPVIGEGDNARMDNAHVNWMRSRSDLRLKLLSKWYPQEYGDKVGIDAKGDINLTISTGIPQK